MKLTAKIVISLLVAAVATFAATLLPSITNPAVLFAVIACATVATVALVSIPAPQQHKAPARKKTTGKPAPKRSPKAADKKPAARPTANDANRVHGLVKWFNVSKGFGFITQDNGEEIFVHFRSIRGEGRRGLRDGQEVTFVVADSDKGPQAEDVEGL
jgi:CspA family cold shock protein